MNDQIHPLSTGPTKSILKNQKGVALMLALTFVLIMMFLAVEVSYDAQVEYRITNSELDRLRAYYAAKAGADFSLLRINIFNQAANQFGSALGSKVSMLDLIWNFPFTWPPMVPDTVNSIDKDQIKETVKKSLLDSQFVAVIEAESGKIDVNDLASPSEALAKATNKQIVQLLKDRLDKDDDFARDNRSLRVEELVNNIADWIDADSESKNGGAEKTAYKDAPEKGIPPNEPMKTLDELHMVSGMTDELYSILLPRLTIYGLKGVGVNRASKEILRSLDAQIDDKVADEIIAWRSDDKAPGKGPFADEDAFKKFLGTQGINVDKFNASKIPLYFGSEKIFRIKSTGQFGRSTREIIAIVYDFDTVKGRLKALMVTPSPSGSPSPSPSGSVAPTPTASPTPSTAATPKSGKPTVVYWFEN